MQSSNLGFDGVMKYDTIFTTLYRFTDGIRLKETHKSHLVLVQPHCSKQRLALRLVTTFLTIYSGTDSWFLLTYHHAQTSSWLFFSLPEALSGSCFLIILPFHSLHRVDCFCHLLISECYTLNLKKKKLLKTHMTQNNNKNQPTKNNNKKKGNKKSNKPQTSPALLQFLYFKAKILYEISADTHRNTLPWTSFPWTHIALVS